MTRASRVTMDRAGRLVVPQPIREAAGLEPGVALEILGEEGRVEIRIPPIEVEVVVGADGLPFARPKNPTEPLDGGTVRETLEAVRTR